MAAMPFVGEKMPTYRDFAGATLGEIYAGSGHLSQSSPWLYFGRGRDGTRTPIRVHVRWPDGRETEHEVNDAVRLVIATPP